MSSPKLSILVPVYNAAPFLRVCLDSILAQTFTDYELICINDGSTDESLKILKSYASKDPRLKFIDKTNSGYGDSLNQALKLAKGKYIGIVEPDDFIEPNMYELLVDRAEALNVDIAKASFYHHYGETGRNLPEKMFFHGESDHVVIPSETPSLFLVSPTIWSAVYRRDLLLKKHVEFLPTPGASYQDLGFAFKTFAVAKSVYCTNLPLYHYRRDNSASSVNSSAKIFAVREEFDAIDAFLTEHHLTEQFSEVSALCRFRSYLWNYNRLSRKSAREFAKIAKADYEKLSVVGFSLNSFNGHERARESKLATRNPSLYISLRPFYRAKNRTLQSLASIYHHLRPQQTPALPDSSIPVSIVIPVYNVEAYLPSCLESILAQTHQNLEVILIDDGSTDNSNKICHDFAKRDPRIRVIRQKNAGLSAARNAGLEKSHHDFIAFIDGDDQIAPTFIADLLAQISADADIVVCGYLASTPDSARAFLPPSPSIITGAAATKRLLISQENYDIMACNKLYRKELFIKNQIRYPVGEINEDSLTTYKLYAAAQNVAACKAPLYIYRQRSGSIMSTSSTLKRLAMRERAARESITYFKDSPDLHSAAEISLLTAKFAFVDHALRGEIPLSHATEALDWLKKHASNYRKNPHLTKKLKLYLKLINTKNSSLYKLFRKAKH